MLAQQRQEVILREVERVGGARVLELVDLLGVSDMTVRRDIEALAVNGLVMKVHGGATAVVGPSAEEPGFHVKSEMNPRQTVVLTGGMRTPSDALAGPVADATLRSLHVDTLILGVHGIDQVAGLTTPNLIEAATNRALIASARRVIVVADHSKWGIIGLSTIATLDQVDALVTDAELDCEARRIVSEQVGQLIEAQPFVGEADQRPRKVKSS